MASSKTVWEAAPYDSKLQFSIAMLTEKYPGIDIMTTTGFPGGDYLDVQIRRRGIREFKTWRVANTFLVTASPTDIVRAIEKIIDGGVVSQEVVVQEGKETPSDNWANEWAKKHEQR